MGRGKFEIDVNDAGNISVNIELQDGSVWLTKHENANQFRVYVPAITTNLLVMVWVILFPSLHQSLRITQMQKCRYLVEKEATQI